jgi:hypothetical protein
MVSEAIRGKWLGLAIGVLWAFPAAAVGQTGSRAEPTAQTSPGADTRQHILASIPWDRLSPKIREGARRTLEQPTLTAHGPAEVFRARPSFYCWLLDHPDRAVQMWHRLGARCLTITDRGGGRFGWADGQGTDISWQTIFTAPGLQVWYAEGMATPGPVLPPIPVKAVVVLRYAASSALSPLIPDSEGRSRTLMFHQADLFLQTDSQAAALITKLLGPSAPKMAERCVGQMEMFFSALAWYVERHPEQSETLLSGLVPSGAAN